MSFVVDEGSLDVLVNGSKQGELGPGKIFGDKELILDLHYTATVRAITESVIFLRFFALLKRTAFLINASKAKLYSKVSPSFYQAF